MISHDLLEKWNKRPDSNKMLQQVYAGDPWKMMVGCIMLNQTTRTQVDKVRHELFKNYSTPEEMAKADPDDIREIIRPLGFYNRRAKAMVKFSHEYLTKAWNSIDELYGIGQYALESWKIFVDGNINIQPADKELKRYLERVENGQEY